MVLKLGFLVRTLCSATILSATGVCSVIVKSGLDDASNESIAVSNLWLSYNVYPLNEPELCVGIICLPRVGIVFVWFKDKIKVSFSSLTLCSLLTALPSRTIGSSIYLNLYWLYLLQLFLLQNQV